MITQGNKYQLITSTLSEMYGELNETTGEIHFHLTLTSPNGKYEPRKWTYLIEDAPINYDTNKLRGNPKEITNLAFGMFLIDDKGYVSLTKSNRGAMSKLISSHPGSIDLELYVNGNVIEYKGKELVIDMPTHVLKQFGIEVLTRSFFNKNIMQTQ